MNVMGKSSLSKDMKSSILKELERLDQVIRELSAEIKKAEDKKNACLILLEKQVGQEMPEAKGRRRVPGGLKTALENLLLSAPSEGLTTSQLAALVKTSMGLDLGKNGRNTVHTTLARDKEMFIRSQEGYWKLKSRELEAAQDEMAEFEDLQWEESDEETDIEML